MTVTLSTIGDTIYRYLGLNDTSSPQPSTPASSAPAAESSGTVSGYLYSAYHALFGTGGLTGCLSEGDQVSDQLADGGDMEQPDGGDGDTTESGAILHPDGTVTLPTDENGTVLPDDIWFEITGQGSFFQETPEIPFVSGYLQGSGLQNLTLSIVMGTDSTLIGPTTMYPETPAMPTAGCFPGMIDVTSAAGWEGFGCPETGYTEFMVCPSNENWRLPVYIGGYTVEGYELVDSEYQLIGETSETLSTVAELYEDTETGTVMGTLCGGTPGVTNITIPAEYYETGAMYLKIYFSLIVDARHVDGNADYRTYLGVSITSQED